MTQLLMSLVAFVLLLAMSPATEVVVSNGCNTGVWIYIQTNPVVPPQYDSMAVWLPPNGSERLLVPADANGVPKWLSATMFFKEEANVTTKFCQPPAGVVAGERSPGYYCKFIEMYHAGLAEWTFSAIEQERALNGSVWYDMSNVKGMGTLPIRMVPHYNAPQSARPMQDGGCLPTETCYITEELCPVHPKYGSQWDAERQQCISDCDLCRMREWKLSGPEQDVGPCREICCPGSTIHEDECWATGVQANSRYAWTAKCACRTGYGFPLDDPEALRRCNYATQMDLLIQLCPATSTRQQALDQTYHGYFRSSHTGRCLDVTKDITNNTTNTLEIFPDKTACVEACVAERAARSSSAQRGPYILL